MSIKIKTDNMKKVIRDGKVGVLISPGHGAGFSTWGYPDSAIFDPTLIELIEADKIQDAVDYCQTTWPDEYAGGVADLKIAWIPEGTKFVIEEYDGAEYIMAQDDFQWLIA